jgi:hypothetical protein
VKGKPTVGVAVGVLDGVGVDVGVLGNEVGVNVPVPVGVLVAGGIFVEVLVGCVMVAV